MSLRLCFARLSLATVLMLGTVGVSDERAAATDSLPENLAPLAHVTASSEFNQQYLARFAVDGKLPVAGGRADLNQAWCVRGDLAGGRGGIQFEWERPVSVAEIVYYGRTAWFTTECWKDYEVYLDDAERPVAAGSFSVVHGPQRIKLDGAKVRKLTLRFLNLYGGPNPGASEIQVFASRLSGRQLTRLTQSATVAAGGSGAPYMPCVDEVDCDKLRQLITRLMSAHGESYSQGSEHLLRLDKLCDGSRNEPAAGVGVASEGVEDELARLQREVLLFDVDKLLVINSP